VSERSARVKERVGNTYHDFRAPSSPRALRMIWLCVRELRWGAGRGIEVREGVRGGG
jgi:hypothetical protein